MRGDCRLAMIVAMLLAVPDLARAQSAPGRGQFFLDFGTAVGTLDVEEPPPTDQTLTILADGNPSGNFAADVNLGWTIARRLGLFGSFGFDIAPESDDLIPTVLSVAGRTTRIAANDHDTSLTVFAFGAQYWPTADLWIRGAVAAVDLERNFSETETGTTVSISRGFYPGFLFATGFNLQRMVGFAMDVRFRYLISSADGVRLRSMGALIGFPVKYPRWAS